MSRLPAPTPTARTESAGRSQHSVASPVINAIPVGVASSPLPPARTRQPRESSSTAGTGTGMSPWATVTRPEPTATSPAVSRPTPTYRQPLYARPSTKSYNNGDWNQQWYLARQSDDLTGAKIRRPPDPNTKMAATSRSPAWQRRGRGGNLFRSFSRVDRLPVLRSAGGLVHHGPAGSSDVCGWMIGAIGLITHSSARRGRFGTADGVNQPVRRMARQAPVCEAPRPFLGQERPLASPAENGRGQDLPISAAAAQKAHLWLAANPFSTCEVGVLNERMRGLNNLNPGQSTAGVDG